MNIRPAQLSDAPAVASLWNAMIRDTLATFTTVEKLYTELEAMMTQRTNAFWVAQESGKVLGFMTYGPFRGGPGYAATAEHTIVLDPQAQGRGLGRALMTQGLSGAQQDGIHTMMAAISGENTPAVSFHAAMGFVQTGRLPEVGRKHETWLDLILMQKTLTPS